MPTNTNTRIEISSKTIIFTVFFLIFLKFIWEVKDLIFSLLIAFIVMSATRPAVAFLEKRKIPRAISSVVIFITSFFLLGWTLSALLPPLLTETIQLLKQLPSILYGINPSLYYYFNFNSFTQYLPDLTNQAIKIIGGAFSNAVFFLSTLFFSFYFINDENFIKKLLMKFFDESKALKVAQIFDQTEKRLSTWFWGELILMTIVGVLIFIGLNLIGIRRALPLAVIAGLLEIVPNIGPITSTIPAIIIAASQSYFLILPAIALFFIVQQLENHLIVPLVMKKAVGLHPIVTLMALIIGGKIGGVLGVLLAVPIALFLETVIIGILQKKVA